MARPENLWLSPASLAKVDDDNYRAFIIDKAHLPFPENQSGSKRLIADTMMSVGIEVDPADITYAPAPGDTRSGFVTVVIVAKVTDDAQLNAKKVWASHPLARSEAVALPDIGIFTLQVANTFNDGPLRYKYDWLRRNDRDMAVLAWEMDEARRAKGFGGVRAVRTAWAGLCLTHHHHPLCSNQSRST